MKVGDGANDRDRDRLAVPRGIKGVKWPGSAEGQTNVTTPIVVAAGGEAIRDNLKLSETTCEAVKAWQVS